MEVHFNNGYLEKLYTGLVNGKPMYTEDVVENFRKKVVILANTENITRLSNLKALNCEALKGAKEGRYSIRVDLEYKLEFSDEKNGILLDDVIFIEDLTNYLNEYL